MADVQFAVIGPQVGECDAADVVHRFSCGCFPECPESESAEKKDPTAPIKPHQISQTVHDWLLEGG